MMKSLRPWMAVIAALIIVMTAFWAFPVTASAHAVSATDVTRTPATPSQMTMAQAMQNMTPEQMAQYGVPGVVIGTGLLASTDPALMASVASNARGVGEPWLANIVGKLPLMTVEQYRAVTANPAASAGETLNATLSLIATAQYLGIAQYFYSEDMWMTVGTAVACGTMLAGLSILIYAVGLALVGVTFGLSLIAAVIVGAIVAVAAGVACSYMLSVSENGAASVKQLQRTSDESYMNKTLASFEEGMQAAGNNAVQFYSEQPFMQYAVYKLADMQALTQVGNSTFDPIQNLQQSGILPLFATSQFSGLVFLLNQALENFTAQASIMRTTDFLTWGGAQLVTGQPLFMVYGNGPLYINSADTNSTILADYYAPNHGSQNGACSTNGPVSLPTLTTIAQVSTGFHVTSSTSTACEAGGTGAVESFAGDYSGAAVVSNGFQAYGSDGSGFGGAKYYLGATDGVPFCYSSTLDCAYSVYPSAGNGGGSLSVLQDNLTGRVVSISLSGFTQIDTAFNDFAALEVNAVANGQVFWQFLREQNITNPNDIPQKYLLSFPAQVLSNGVCVENISIYEGTSWTGICDNLNLNESYSLYLAWLYDLGAINATNYQTANTLSCATAAACTFWGNLNEYAFGNVYVPNAAPQNTSYQHEALSNPATWAITNSQLIVFPQVSNDTIQHYNATWEIPIAAPIAIYATHAETFESLLGNGTTDGAVATTSAGDALFVKYCSVYQKTVTAASGECTFSPYTAQFTFNAYICGPNSIHCSSSNITINNGGCGDLFGLSGIFGGGTLGCVIGWIVDIIIVIIIVFVVIAIVRALTSHKKE